MFKKFSLYTLAMLLIPVVTWLANWHWSLAIQYAEFDFDYFLYLITETGSVPYAIITCVVFALLLAWVVRKRYSLIFVITVCIASMVATQAIKTAMKSTFQEPRPFVSALFQEKTDDFYQLTREQRGLAVMEKSVQIKISLPLTKPKKWAILSHQATLFLRFLGYYWW